MIPLKKIIWNADCSLYAKDKIINCITPNNNFSVNYLQLLVTLENINFTFPKGCSHFYNPE